jgi:hypothetical protein
MSAAPALVTAPSLSTGDQLSLSTMPTASATVADATSQQGPWAKFKALWNRPNKGKALLATFVAAPLAIGGAVVGTVAFLGLTAITLKRLLLR